MGLQADCSWLRKESLSLRTSQYKSSKLKSKTNKDCPKKDYPRTITCLVAQSCLTLCNPMDCSSPGSLVHGDSPGQNTGVGCHVLLQEIFPTQVSCIIVSATREAIQGLQNNYKMYIIHVWENQKQKKERNRKKISETIDWEFPQINFRHQITDPESTVIF